MRLLSPVLLLLTACQARPIVSAADDAGSVPFFPAAHDPFPLMQTQGGLPLAPLQLVTITTAGDPLEARLTTFGEDVVQSHWWQTIAAEYQFDPSATHTHVSGPAIADGTTLSDEETQQYIRDLIDAGAAPQPNGRHVYVLFLPSGVSADFGGSSNENCRLYLGYHSAFLAGFTDNRAVVQRCENLLPLSTVDMLTAVATHEIAESVTNPANRGWLLGTQQSQPWSHGGSPWAVSSEREVGDPCNRAFVAEGREVYQRIWADSAAQMTGDPCVPATGEPYFNVQPGQDWYGVRVGEPLTIPLTGWSNAPTGDWEVTAATAHSDGLEVHWHLSAPTTQTIGIVEYSTINNGGTAQIDLTISQGRPRNFLLFQLMSTRQDWAQETLTPTHYGYENSNFVGIYVE
jgi:hypothetical protein